MLRTIWVAAVALGVCAAVSACSSSNSSSNSSSTGGSGAGGSGAGGSSAGGAGGGSGGLCTSGTPSSGVTDISGHWAFQTVGSQLVHAPAIPNPFHTRVISLELVDLTQTGKDVTMKGSYCARTVQTDSQAAQTVLPDAFVKALQPYTRSGTYEVTGGLGHFKAADFPEVLGAHLADPMKDALPTDPNDPRVFDQDQDGHPGMTVKITGLINGDAYVVQRQITSYDGLAITKDHLQGMRPFSSEQVVLDSNPILIKNQSPTGTTDPVACNSHFDAVRLPASADCQYVVDHAATLFPTN